MNAEFVSNIVIVFQLYNEVKARREASESSTNNKNLDITLLNVNSQYSHQANGYHEPHGHPNNSLPFHQCSEIKADPSVMQSLGFHHPSEYCNGSNNYMLNSLSNGSHYPASRHDLERQDATVHILNGYLQQGPHFRRNPGNLGAPNRVSTSFTVDKYLLKLDSYTSRIWLYTFFTIFLHISLFFQNPKVYPVKHSYQDSMKTSLVTNR